MKNNVTKPRVVELFAGVGGFRVGLNEVELKNNKVIEKDNFDFVFFNQWEPNNSKQHAYNCYSKRFNEKFNPLHNTDISKINKKDIPDHDLLVGGFPCQDYSVARSLKGESGIEGKKGVLWWQIDKILEVKKPNFVLLENVDRLLISPSKQRGRDFSIMLKCFDLKNYYVEWKVINAADYGMPQKRKRVFIFACKKNTLYFKNNIKPFFKKDEIIDFVKTKKSFFSSGFEFEIDAEKSKYDFPKIFNQDLLSISDNFICDYKDSGVMFDSKIYTYKTVPSYNGNQKKLKDILEKFKNVNNDFIITDDSKLNKIKYLKSSKRIKRVSKDGYEYWYSEGKMQFPENLDLPGRTLLTSEGSTNRSTHIIKQNNYYRTLTSIECERMNMFPDDWTNVEGITTKMRYFLMGNALVCGIIKRLSNKLKHIILNEKN